MAEMKKIAVLGGTGAQGGGLVRAMLADPGRSFIPRVLTRNVDSEKSRALKEQGAEVVAANVDDAQSMRRAFEGVDGAFCVTFFWEHFSPEKEQNEVKEIARAAKDAGVPHVIWSTLEDTRKLVPLSDNRMPTLMEHYKVPHFDSKGGSDHFFADAGVPTTYLLTSFYWDNLIHFGMGPKPGPNGVLLFTLPMGDKRLPGIAAEDIGRCAYGIFKRGKEFINRRIGIAGEMLTGSQMAAGLTRALGREVKYNAISFDQYRKLGFPGAEDLGNMFQYKHDFEAAFCGARDLALARELNPQLQTFDMWLAKNARKIPLQ